MGDKDAGSTRVGRRRVWTDIEPQLTVFGTTPDMLRKNFMHLCTTSLVGSNIRGQPPSITVMPCARPYSVAAGETLPAPLERCIHTWRIPISAHSRMVTSAVSGLVPITTAPTPPGMDFRSG